ncbi:MAG TPA: helix-hairpin-helix domain-containing protein [Gemmatimonadales bacterium]|nr:helix-hairpin-helix domain-containing protein [Gemmatimonadales bacterium]
MERAERRALVLLLGLAVAGQGVRLLGGRAGAPPGELTLLSERRDGVPTAHRDSAAAADRPLAEGETIDVDRASARALARLPRVGPALARTIVADREARGPFGSLEGLDRVPGVGPGLLRQLGPHVRFGGTEAAPAVPPPSGTTLATTPPGPEAPIDLNAASADELDGVPGLGPARARNLVAWRAAHGPFGSVEALAAVPGIGPKLAARIWAATAHR